MANNKISDEGLARLMLAIQTTASRVVVFFEDDGRNGFKDQFRNITCFADPPSAKKGGVSEVGCQLLLPDGRLFHGMVYHGDLRGWRTDLEGGAEGLGLLLGQIEGDRFVMSDGVSIKLTDCEVKSY